MWFFKKEKVGEKLKGVERMEFSDKGRFLHIKGEKYPLRGMPRSNVLQLLYPFKKLLLNAITKELVKLFPYEIPDKQLSEPVKELARVFDLMIEAEDNEGMKAKWRAIKKGMCMFLEEDDAYRYRAQWFLSKLDMKKMKLTKGDKYYFRGKHFKVDD